jgi:uncharacterized membrane protein YfcA
MALDEIFLLFILIGFVAQLIDGTLGMAYGVASSTALMALGMPPAIISANVHAAEVFTTAASGVSHAIARNVDWRLFARLTIAGALGGATGAFLISRLDLDFVRPVIAGYLLFMGLIVIRRAFPRSPKAKPVRRVSVLGFFGGMVDAIGGGGWGPVVASNLIARNGTPATIVGTVNLAEFLVTLSISLAFLAALGPSLGKAALGLVIGGVAAAPIAAFGAKKLPTSLLTALVGLLIVLLSAYNLYRALS